jgi:hypothetical protein
MSGVAGASAVALAFVLLVAAVTKVRDRTGTRSSFRGLGVPAPNQLAVAVPVAEGAVAVALVFVPIVGGIAASVLLASFTAAVARAIAQRRNVPCACFGARTARPVSGRTLVRNAGLIVLALVATAAGREGARPTLPGAIVVTGAIAVVLVMAAIDDVRRTTGRLVSTEMTDS